MMAALPKSHEDRIADLERQVTELKRIVGVPGGALAGLGAVMGVGVIRNPDGSVSNPQGLTQAHAQQAMQEAAQRATLAYQQASQERLDRTSARPSGNVAQAEGNLCQAQSLNQCSTPSSAKSDPTSPWFSGYENLSR